MLTTKRIMQLSSMGSMCGIKGSMQFAITDNKEVEKKGAKSAKNRAFVVTRITDIEFFLHQVSALAKSAV